MKRPTITGLVLLALLAFAASPSSALEGLLPLNQSFTVLSKSVIFENTKLEKIVCGETKGNGQAETNSDTHGVITLDFLKCELRIQTLGFTAFSLGEKEPKELKEALVLMRASYLLCLVNSASLLFGVFLSLLEAVHIHIKALGALVNVTGSVIGHVLGKVEPLKLLVVDFVGKDGKQTPTECKDEAGNVKKAELKWEEDPEAPVPLSMETEGESFLLQFTNTVELMDK